jgi:hypothetical protein
MKKLYFGHYITFSFILLLIIIFTIFLKIINSNIIFDYIILVFNGWLSGVILFFWMTYNLFNNDKVKFKLLWFLSFLIMFIGCIFYFWFIYRKQDLNENK